MTEHNSEKGRKHMETILRAEKLRKDEILKDISFSVYQGEMVAIMGPSGFGRPAAKGMYLPEYDQSSGDHFCG